jgi:hypothetical protein
VVDLEWSLDGGQSWSAIAVAEPNDGSYFWQVPQTVADQTLVRVRRQSLTGLANPPFPSSCSGDRSDNAFAIGVAPPAAGAVPAATPAEGGLALSVDPEGTLTIRWGPSCSTDAEDYAVYEGSLDSLRDGLWLPAPATCSTTGALATTLAMPQGDRYFLVVPIAGDHEGSMGRDSFGGLRAEPPGACAPRESPPTCE